MNSIVWIILNNNIAVHLWILITQLKPITTKAETFQEDLFFDLNKCVIKNSLFKRLIRLSLLVNQVKQDLCFDTAFGILSVMCLSIYLTITATCVQFLCDSELLRPHVSNCCAIRNYYGHMSPIGVQFGINLLSTKIK